MGTALLTNINNIPKLFSGSKTLELKNHCAEKLATRIDRLVQSTVFKDKLQRQFPAASCVTWRATQGKLEVTPYGTDQYEEVLGEEKLSKKILKLADHVWKKYARCPECNPAEAPTAGSPPEAAAPKPKKRVRFADENPAPKPDEDKAAAPKPKKKVRFADENLPPKPDEDKNETANELLQKIAQDQALINELRDKLRLTEGWIEELNQQLASKPEFSHETDQLNEGANELLQKIAQDQALIGELKDQLPKAQAESKDLKEKLLQAEKDLQGLRQKLEHGTKASSDLKDKLAAAEKKADQSETESKDLTQKLLQTEKKLQEALEWRQKYLDSERLATANLAELQKQLKSAEEKTEKFRSELFHAQNKILSLEQNPLNIQEGPAPTQNSNDEELEKLQRRNEELMAALDRTASMAQEEIRALLKAKNEHEDKFQDALAKNAEERAKLIGELNGLKIKQAQENHPFIPEKVNSQEEKIEKLQKALQKQKEEADRILNQKIEEYHAAENHFKDKIDALEKRIAQLLSLIEQGKDEAHILENELIASRTHDQFTQAKMRDLEEEHKQTLALMNQNLGQLNQKITEQELLEDEYKLSIFKKDRIIDQDDKLIKDAVNAMRGDLQELRKVYEF